MQAKLVQIRRLEHEGAQVPVGVIPRKRLGRVPQQDREAGKRQEPTLLGRWRRSERPHPRQNSGGSTGALRRAVSTVGTLAKLAHFFFFLMG